MFTLATDVTVYNVVFTAASNIIVYNIMFLVANNGTVYNFMFTVTIINVTFHIAMFIVANTTLPFTMLCSM